MLSFYGFTLPQNNVKPTYNIYVGSGERQVIVELDGEFDMVKVLNPIRRKYAIKRSDANNTKAKILSVKNEIESLKVLKKELDQRISKYGRPVTVIILLIIINID